MFSKILIANRGEIAVRIIRACKEMGIGTVAVFSEADRDALHVSLADESICIGPARVQDSYLNMTAILSAAVETKSQAIHPGYGLLSENARFAELCEKCGVTFIGPSARLISLLGDKDQAKRTMRDAGVPVVPGCDLVPDVETAKREAGKIGFPLLVKARAGGGGRGIRLVNEPGEVESAFLASSTEAQNAFGDGACYMERFLKPVKHIEMQILCDRHGHTVCLGERDCSIQRKNQKLLEESPSPFVTPELREKMMDAAVRAAGAVGYDSVGTIEFLVDRDRNFYFMEMNTRLQVEHPVTELVTGLDLVKWQIRVACGIPLGFTQEDLALRGACIECRINARSTGKITTLHVPGGPFVRFDTFLIQGGTISPFYDSLLGKLIVWASDRDEAVRKMRAALCELVIEGVETNIEEQLALIGEQDFVLGTYDLRFMEGR